MEENKYHRIWQLLQKGTPSQREKIINSLSEEELIEVRHQANPYRKPLYTPGKKYLEFSYINMYREYERNLMMTTIVGFMYKMATEYTPAFSTNKEKKYPSET